MKNIHQSWRLPSKNTKDINATPTQKQKVTFLIIIESLQDIKFDQLSPFLIEKIISSRSILKNVKNTSNWKPVSGIRNQKKNSRKPTKNGEIS